MCAYPLMSPVLAKWSLSGTPAIFLNTLQENEYISLLLSQSYSVSAKLTFASILPRRLLPSLSSSNMFCPLWPPWVSFWRPDWGLSVPFSSPTERSKFSALLFFFFSFFFCYAFAMFHVNFELLYRPSRTGGKTQLFWQSSCVFNAK